MVGLFNNSQVNSADQAGAGSDVADFASAALVEVGGSKSRIAVVIFDYHH